MKAITIYEASDGTRFDSADLCARYEIVIGQVAPITSRMPKHDLGYGECVQLDKEQCNQYKSDLVDLCRELFPNESVFKHDAEKIHPSSYAGRFLSECSYPCLYTAWHRCMCINWENYCQYNRPYFANNPHEVEPA